MAHPDHPLDAGALEVVHLEPNVVLGVGGSNGPSLRTLTPSDVQGYELRGERLANQLKAALKIPDTVHEIEPGTWELGHRQLGRVRICVFGVFREPDPATLERIGMRTGNERAVFITPRGRAWAAADIAVGALLPAGHFDDILPSIIEALGPAAEVPAVEKARPGTRLVIDTVQQVMWLDGIKLSRLEGDSHPYRFALAVLSHDTFVRVLRRNRLLQRLF